MPFTGTTMVPRVAHWLSRGDRNQTAGRLIVSVFGRRTYCVPRADTRNDRMSELLNLIGLSTGVALYAMLLVMVDTTLKNERHTAEGPRGAARCVQVHPPRDAGRSPASR